MHVAQNQSSQKDKEKMFITSKDRLSLFRSCLHHDKTSIPTGQVGEHRGAKDMQPIHVLAESVGAVLGCIVCSIKVQIFLNKVKQYKKLGHNYRHAPCKIYFLNSFTSSIFQSHTSIQFTMCTHKSNRRLGVNLICCVGRGKGIFKKYFSLANSHSIKWTYNILPA